MLITDGMVFGKLCIYLNFSPGTVIPPIIIHQPTQKMVDIYQNVTLYCEAEGFQVAYLWKNCDGNIIGRQSSVTLLNVTPDDNGQYHCEASNVGGSVSSNTVKLEVKGIH